ncbi:MAG TPA: hypothetical protein VEL07_21490 [Planctomycetota bacterium]|nr:hypothetical protein [Planctomycetota bacterium]
MRLLILILLCVSAHAASERRDIVERSVREALGSARETAPSFQLRIGDLIHAATIVVHDDATLTAEVDGARLTMPWSDLADADLLTLAQAVLAKRAATHLMLAQFAFDAGLIEQAKAEIERHVAVGGKEIPTDERMFEELRLQNELERRQLAVARAKREQLAEQAWSRVMRLIDEGGGRERILGALNEYEHAWDGTEFLIGKSAEIALRRRDLRADP